MMWRNLNQSKRIYLSISNENIYNNYCAFNINQKNEYFKDLYFSKLD